MLRTLCLFIVFLAVSFAPARADERILLFDAQVTVEADGAFLVKETIEVNAEGQRIRRGIFRDFPLVFTLEDGKERKVGFELISVTRNGAAENAALEWASRAVRIRIGSRDVFLDRGRHRYEITYRTDRQLRRFDTHDEVFWNVTGNAWVFPIDKATATVRLPQGATATDSIYFTGRLGDQGKNASQSVREGGNVVQFVTTRPLNRYEGLTVGVKFAKGIVPPPTTQQQIEWFIRDHRGAIIALIGLVVVSFYYLFMWSKIGRDPPKDTVVPRWDLPDGISPALAHYIYNRGFKKRATTAVSATLLNLAVRGILNLDNDDGKLTIRKVKPTTGQSFTIGEQALMSTLGGYDSFRVDKSNGTTVQTMIRAFERNLSAEHRHVFYKSNAGYVVLGVVLSVLACFAAVAFGGLTEESLVVLIPAIVGGGIITSIIVNLGRSLSSGGLGAKLQMIFVLFIAGSFVYNIGLTSLGSWMNLIDNPWLYGAIITIVMVNVLFAFLMGAPTPIGQKRSAQIEGLRHYMSVAEEDRMNMLNSPEMSPKHYETLLPYAVALGVEKPWSRAFQTWLAAAVAAGAAGVAAYHGPSWYRGDGGFSPDTIGDTMGSIGNDIASSMTSAMPAPKSSSSGFSGGGGGGGFSGGGGGGGGGGGW